jgi:hypothetical protein
MTEVNPIPVENSSNFIITTKKDFSAVIERLSEESGESVETIVIRMLKIGSEVLDYNIMQRCPEVHINFENGKISAVKGFKNKKE